MCDLGGVVGTFSFINRKRHKLVLQAEGGFRARVHLSFVAYLLPITTQVRSPALHGVYHYLWRSLGKVVWVTEALALGALGMRGLLGC